MQHPCSALGVWQYGVVSVNAWKQESCLLKPSSSWRVESPKQYRVRLKKKRSERGEGKLFLLRTVGPRLQQQNHVKLNVPILIFSVYLPIFPPVMEGLIFFSTFQPFISNVQKPLCWLLLDLLIRQDSQSASNRSDGPSPPLTQLHAQDRPQPPAPLCFSHKFPVAESERARLPSPTPCCKLNPPTSCHCHPGPPGEELGQSRATCADGRRLCRAPRWQRPWAPRLSSAQRAARRSGYARYPHGHRPPASAPSCLPLLPAAGGALPPSLPSPPFWNEPFIIESWNGLGWKGS